jgi:hypothetical protein
MTAMAPGISELPAKSSVYIDILSPKRLSVFLGGVVSGRSCRRWLDD